jgi:hypothetical protein
MPSCKANQPIRVLLSCDCDEGAILVFHGRPAASSTQQRPASLQDHAAIQPDRASGRFDTLDSRATSLTSAISSTTTYDFNSQRSPVAFGGTRVAKWQSRKH